MRVMIDGVTCSNIGDFGKPVLLRYVLTGRRMDYINNKCK